MSNPISLAIRLLLAVYQKAISPLKPPTCRFHPTCSQYMREAVEKKGVIRGLLAGARRVLRCHPLSPGGFDPVDRDA